MNTDKLVVVWLSADKRSALDMATLYARDSLLAGWFKEAKLVLWGPPVELAVTDKGVETELEILQSVGVELFACFACARAYGVVEKLEALSIQVIPMGEKLTAYLKGEACVIFV